MPSELETGILVGLLIGEGHFGGDGRQPQVTLRMNVRHEAMFRWIETAFPGGRLYGPYHHGGRHYFQWMARGAFLREELLPILERSLSAELDRESFQRFRQMCDRYGLSLSASTPAAKVATAVEQTTSAGARGGPGGEDGRLEEAFARLRADRDSPKES